jgi:hypothetical protein
VWLEIASLSIFPRVLPCRCDASRQVLAAAAAAAFVAVHRLLLPVVARDSLRSKSIPSGAFRSALLRLITP